jgi:hypothetical protein
MSSAGKVIIFVPGIRPKPPAKDHQEALWRCLLEGVRQIRPDTAAAMQSANDAFHVVPWSFEYYREYGDIQPDLPAIEALLKKSVANAVDVAEAKSLWRRIQRKLYSLADSMPLVTRLFAPDSLRLRLSEMNGYFDNSDHAGDRIRLMVKQALLNAWQENRKVMLIGHSFGSVIAYDALWELGHLDGVENRLDTFISMGSPMGLRYIRQSMKGDSEKGARQFPINIRCWRNLAAVGEVTAQSPAVPEFQQAMAAAGWLEEHSQHAEVVNFFRGPTGLNVHKCYGYFYNPQTAKIIADWWDS